MNKFKLAWGIAFVSVPFAGLAGWVTFKHGWHDVMLICAVLAGCFAVAYIMVVGIIWIIDCVAEESARRLQQKEERK